MADNFSALRTSRKEPSLFEQVRTSAQLTPEAQYEMTSGASDTQFQKGLRSGAAGLTAGSFANEALSQEAGGDADWQRSRDLALQTQAQAQMYAPRVSSLRDIGSLEDAGDFAAGALGQGVMSMAPTLATALATSRLGPVAPYIGGAAAAYGLERGEAALNQYADPTLAATSAEDRNRAATVKGGINAGLEAIVPAGLAGSVLRRPAGSAFGKVAHNALTEGATETAQQGVGFAAENYLDPSRQLDPWDLADAAASGLLTGGGTSAATLGTAYGARELANQLAPGPQEDSAPTDPADAPPGGVSDAPNDQFGPEVREQAQSTKDFIADTVARMGEAAQAARNPSEFLQRVFSNPSEEAAVDLRPDIEDPSVLNAVDPAEALRRRDAERQERAARFAEELLNDPATPESVKERVVSFGGDFTNPEAQAYVARSLVKQRAGEKLATAATDLVDMSKGLGSRVREAVDRGVNAATDRIVKKNLQDATPAEQAAFNKLIFDNLTDEAKANPTVRQRLPEIANAMLAFAARTGDLTKADLKTLSRLQDGMAMFRDPDSMAAQLTEYAGIPRTEDSFLSRIKRVTNAQQDVRQPNSFLYASLTEEARESLRPAQLNQLARLVDDFTLNDTSKAQGDKVLAGLAAAFGSRENAQAVLDYYQQQNHADVRLDANETLVGGTMTERDGAPAPSYQFADAKTRRPFRTFAGRMNNEGGMRRRLRESTLAGAALRRGSPDGADVRPVKMSQYVADTGGDPEAEVKRIAADIKKRITQHKARKGEDRSQQINVLEGELSMMRKAYRDGGAEAALDLYEVLQVSEQERNDTVATDEEIARMATLANAKDAKETRVTFQREDGSKFTLSAESMWKTLGDREGSGRGENAQARAKRLFADAAASVLARPEVAKMVTPMEDVLIDRRLGTRAKKKSNPEYRRAVAKALKDSEESLTKLSKTLDAVIDEYIEADDADAKSDAYLSRREEIEAVIDQNIGQLSGRLDAARRGDGPLANNTPAQTVARQKLRMYREALGQIDAIKFEEEFNERDDNRPGIPGANDVEGPLGPTQLPRTRMNEELSNPGIRFAEEDTGLGVGVERRRAAKSEPKAEPKPEPSTKRGPRAGSMANPHVVPMSYRIGNVARLRPELRQKYSASDGIAALIENGDRTGTTRTPPQGVLVGDYISFPGVPGVYRVTGFAKIDLKTDSGREAWSKREGWSVEAADSFGAQVRHGKIQMQFERADSAERAPPAKPAPEPKTLSDVALTALYDVAVNENYSRLDTPEKVLRYAAMARAALDQIEQIPEDARTDQQDALRFKLRDDFNQSGFAAFDWDMMFDGMKPTAEQRALLKDIVAKKSAMGAKKGRPGKIDQQKILEEIRRVRGDKVNVVFQKFSEIGGSGEFSMNRDKTDRLIKIAVNASNPMSTAWHESLHDFFAMLGEDRAGRSIKKDLVAAAGAPQVKRRLRELLAKHPEALAQLEESPEERVAYMYQFWAEGQLRLGPTGTGIFQRLQELFNDLFGLVRTDQRAEDLLTALHEGKFAEPSTVAEVLADLRGDRFVTKVEKASPALTAAMRKVISAAPDRLRYYQNDSLTELADMFSSERGELGFIQKRFQQQGIWENRLARVLEGTTVQERRAAVANMQAMKPPSSKLEKDLAAFFSDMHDYLSGAGVKTLDSKTKQWVPLRKIINYFPRVFDRSALMADRDGFIALLQRYGNMDLKQANATVDALIHGTGQLELAENEHALGFTPYANSVQDRRFTFIQPSNASEFAKYQVKDLADITAGYVKQAVHRAEYARMFGNDGEAVARLVVESGIKDPKELSDISKAVQGLEGSLGNNMSTRTKELMSGIMTLQNIVVLPMAIFSQMIDPVILAARSNDLRDAGNAYVTAVKRLAGQKVDGEELANMLGIVSQDSVLEAMGATLDTAYMSRRMRKINQMFFRYNGLQGWNNSMRIAATAAGERYLIANRSNIKALAEVGLTPKDVKVDREGRLNVNSPKVQEAMFRFVDQAVLRPSASNRPAWMSDPRFLLVAHLKQFTFAMHNVVLKRATRELADGNARPWGILMLAMPVVLAADLTKFALTGTTPSSWEYKDYLVHAVARSGLLGPGDFAVQTMQSAGRGKVPGEELLGPTFEHLMEILRWIGGDPRVDADDVLDRTIPGSRFL